MTVAARQMAERKTVGHLYIARCDLSPVPEPAEHDLDMMASFVCPLVVFDRFPQDFRAGMQCLIPFSSKACLLQSAS
jgi:hypothetical protein